MINYIRKDMNKNLKFRILSFLGRHSKNGKAAFMLSYLHNHGHLPNLKDPKNISEIWIKRVLEGKVNEIAYLADKFAVRKYVEEKGLSNILTPLIAVYNRAEDINFDALPKRFAMKANFGAGFNIICDNKNRFNEADVINEARTWLIPMHYSESEQHYNLIEPKIVVEEFIDDGSGGFPIDYKFMCIRGKVFCILGVNGRENGCGSYMPYSVDWKAIPEYYRGDTTATELLARPKNLDEMIATAEKLAEGIDLVRVDLYSNGSRIWFGEMTLTPSGCIFHHWTQKALDEMGHAYLNYS